MKGVFQASFKAVRTKKEVLCMEKMIKLTDERKKF